MKSGKRRFSARDKFDKFDKFDHAYGKFICFIVIRFNCFLAQKQRSGTGVNREDTSGSLSR